MKTLYDIPKIWNPEEIEEILNNSTIFDKIEFSQISKETLNAMIIKIETVNVPNRTVLLNMVDADVAEYWFKNRLHPMLRRAVNHQGVGGELNAKRGFLRTYENGQQNFKYTLQDIKNYIIGVGL